jgi:hypothetical protein
MTQSIALRSDQAAASWRLRRPQSPCCREAPAWAGRYGGRLAPWVRASLPRRVANAACRSVLTGEPMTSTSTCPDGPRWTPGAPDWLTGSCPSGSADSWSCVTTFGPRRSCHPHAAGGFWPRRRHPPSPLPPMALSGSGKLPAACRRLDACHCRRVSSRRAPQRERGAALAAPNVFARQCGLKPRPQGGARTGLEADTTTNPCRWPRVSLSGALLHDLGYGSSRLS